MKEPNAKELKELIIKCWMTHDGMWFYHCQREFGMEAANRLNKAAISSLAEIEAKRVQQAFQLGKIATFEDLQRLTQAMFQTVKGDFMVFTFTFPEENLLHFNMEKCFAYEGMVMMGVIDRYECGIFHRVLSWFDVLGLKYRVEPEVKGCMLLTEGRCYRDVRFEF